MIRIVLESVIKIWTIFSVVMVYATLGKLYLKNAVKDWFERAIDSRFYRSIYCCALLFTASEGHFRLGFKTRIHFCSAGQISSNAQDFVNVIQPCRFPSNVN